MMTATQFSYLLLVLNVLAVPVSGMKLFQFFELGAQKHHIGERSVEVLEVENSTSGSPSGSDGGRVNGHTQRAKSADGLNDAETNKFTDVAMFVSGISASPVINSTENAMNIGMDGVTNTAQPVEGWDKTSETLIFDDYGIKIKGDSDNTSTSPELSALTGSERTPSTDTPTVEDEQIYDFFPNTPWLRESGDCWPYFDDRIELIPGEETSIACEVGDGCRIILTVKNITTDLVLKLEDSLKTLNENSSQEDFPTIWAGRIKPHEWIFCTQDIAPVEGDISLQRWIYIVPVYLLLVSGIIGNVLLFVLMQIRYPAVSFSVYLRFISVYDTLFLIMNSVEDLVFEKTLGETSILSSTLWSCRVTTWFLSSTATLSPWFMAAFTVDRFVKIAFPFKSSTLSSMKKTWLIASVGTCCICIGSGITAFQYTLVDDPDYARETCGLNQDDSFFIHTMERYRFLVEIFPTFIIFAFNFGIIIAVQRSASFRKSLQASSSSSSTTGSGTRTRDNRIAVSLISLSMFALVTLVPISIMQFIETFRPPTEGFPGYVYDTLFMMRLLNHSQNLYAMLITSQNFRQEFKHVLVFCGLTKSGPSQ